MSHKENPLGDRGKAAEDAWIKQQEREAREKAKREGKTGKGDAKTGANKDKKSSPAK